MTVRMEISDSQRITYTQTWDVDNRLIDVISGTQHTQFYYDSGGTLVKKVDPRGTTAYVGGDDEIAWLVPTQTITITIPATLTHKLYLPMVAMNTLNATTGVSTTYYRFNGTRVAMRTGNNVYWLHGDHLGSASLVTSITGTVVSEMRYYPFGEVRYQSGAMPTDRTFTGQRVDSYSNIIQMGARWYSPVSGRFLAPDSIVPRPGDPQTYNRYSYGLNNPVRYRDPSGHTFEDAVAFLTGILYGWGNANTHIMGASLLPEEVHHNAEALTVQRSDFAVGRIVGDALAVTQGLGESGIGLGGMAGGGLLCVSGVGCLFGAPEIGISSIALVHGGLTAVNAATDMGKQIVLFAESRATSSQGHHPWPKYLGGPKNQPLYDMNTKLHEKYHAGLDKIISRFDGSKVWDELTLAERQDIIASLRDYNLKFDQANSTSTLEALERALKETGINLP